MKSHLSVSHEILIYHKKIFSHCWSFITEAKTGIRSITVNKKGHIRISSFSGNLNIYNESLLARLKLPVLLRGVQTMLKQRLWKGVNMQLQYQRRI